MRSITQITGYLFQLRAEFCVPEARRVASNAARIVFDCSISTPAQRRRHGPAPPDRVQALAKLCMYCLYNSCFLWHGVGRARQRDPRRMRRLYVCAASDVCQSKRSATAQSFNLGRWPARRAAARASKRSTRMSRLHVAIVHLAVGAE